MTTCWIVKADSLYWCGLGRGWADKYLVLRFATREDAERQTRRLGHPNRRVVKLVKRSTLAPRKEQETKT